MHSRSRTRRGRSSSLPGYIRDGARPAARGAPLIGAIRGHRPPRHFLVTQYVTLVCAPPPPRCGPERRSKSSVPDVATSLMVVDRLKAWPSQFEIKTSAVDCAPMKGIALQKDSCLGRHVMPVVIINVPKLISSGNLELTLRGTYMHDIEPEIFNREYIASPVNFIFPILYEPKNAICTIFLYE
ncbi:hypothetical protein EVAR_45333_1 [Eumeta japonica]|uniref:Uncharacterized protein n=1 Tax=Eumeta variegata TaxID=151549 RepID=A0A4C1XQ08_EUMVA|nr:hypothetical protein EVAR_45333_1 [Eumeta japonica]